MVTTPDLVCSSPVKSLQILFALTQILPEEYPQTLLYLLHLTLTLVDYHLLELLFRIVAFLVVCVSIPIYRYCTTFCHPVKRKYNLIRHNIPLTCSNSSCSVPKLASNDLRPECTATPKVPHL